MKRLKPIIMLGVLSVLYSCTNEVVSLEDSCKESHESKNVQTIRNYIARNHSTISRNGNVTLCPITNKGDTVAYLANYSEGWELFSNNTDLPMVLMKSKSGSFYPKTDLEVSPFESFYNEMIENLTSLPCGEQTNDTWKLYSNEGGGEGGGGDKEPQWGWIGDALERTSEIYTPLGGRLTTKWGQIGNYKPNTRETVRRQTVHQFVAAGLVVYNPDCPERPVNSPKAVYQLSPEAVELIKSYGSDEWQGRLEQFLDIHQSLASQYAHDRDSVKVPLKIKDGVEIQLSPGEHSQLIRDIVEEFGPRFAPGSDLVYVGDTGDKWGYADEGLLVQFGIPLSSHGKMPDVVLYDRSRDWLFLVESVTSHGPMDGKRISELKSLFPSANAVFVSAFPNRSVMTKYLSTLAWETEVWISDSPSHLIHFNGNKFLGPYS